ncbi:MAG: UDP-N-acetylmuramoyl-tripeptide--D-alanyl-D-alanine ligase [Bacteroidales bacterium]|jgi:UDP-N-acetylmuramoyl-tripeptide--D-alanyl-D-alanine ligase|nr:UDP-N-acetylmuramoyl-tripeptide--D-alanyl-D-alanine ligase [Bacteroidales bacterium]
MIDKLYNAYLASRHVTTDSRAITPGCIFFAFRGANFDGNAFAPQALEQGAALCVISDPQYKVDDRCIVVPDVLATLQELAREHRRHLTIPVIGITGTNGKTTTKELVHAVLARRYKTSATAGNFNNHLGVPLTILAIPADTQIAIVEMGANHPGEIAGLCSIADPDCGLITNVGRAHLEGFGSFDGVIRTKTELYRHLAAKNGLVFVNADNEHLMPIAKNIDHHLTYGSSAEADTRGTYVGSDPYMHFYFEVGDNVYNTHSHLLGAYNFDNAMAAVAVGLHFGVEPWDIKEAIEAYTPANQRSQWKETANNNLYLDCYNANPSSMAAALRAFSDIKAPHKAAIIGAMRELGSTSLEEHQRLVDTLNKSHLDYCLLIGPEFDGISLTNNTKHVNTTEEAITLLKEWGPKGYTILIKGSNSNRLWTLEEFL